MSIESTPSQCEAARAASCAEAVVASTLPSDTTISAAEMLTRTLAHIDQRYAAGGGLVGLTTGFPDLDHHTGGLRTGDLVVVPARPSMGKSAFALAIAAANAAPGVDRKGVAMFCLEMSAVWVGARWLAMTSGVPLRLLTHGIPDLVPEKWTPRGMVV